MEEETLLLNPGPVMMHQSVRDALSQQMISHRMEDFSGLYDRVRSDLRHVYTNSRTDGRESPWDGEVFFLNATATLGMDAAVANFTDRDSRALCLINGHFGRRFAQIANRQCTVDEYAIPWGESFDVETVREEIVTNEYDIVTMVHTETSTGIRNPIGAIGQAVSETDGLFIVDGVSSIGGERLHPHEWGIDVSVVDAQKALAASPGVCGLFLSQKALDRLDNDQSYFYADLHRHRERANERNQTPFTSAVTLFYGLEASLDRITDIGMGSWLRTYERRASAWESAMTAMGLDLFGNPTGPTDFANTVTAIDLPPSITADPDPFFETIRDHDVFIGGGHAHLSGDIFRLGTMGELSVADMTRGIGAIGAGLAACDVDADVDGAKCVVEEILKEG